MILIHADRYGNDIEIINDFDFDLAYGKDENNFELTLASQSYNCEYGDIVYIVDIQRGEEIGTEYGGVIDGIEIDTEDKKIVYRGRTWHGILAGKIIMPEFGQDYYVVSGNAHDIISEILEKVGLDMSFSVPSYASPINIAYYRFPRYVDAYTGIREMLAESGGKLKFQYNGRTVDLSSVWLTDYSQDDEWDSTQVDFKIKSTKNFVNHLICLGGGKLKNRHVIHLFADENGMIQPYARVNKPIQDSDYILTEDNKKQLWTFEICEVLDYPNAADTDNYIKLTSQPSNWDENFMEYYYLDSNEEFKNIEIAEDSDYEQLTKVPDDWTTNYAKYYTASPHKNVEGIETTSYTQLTEKPVDWDVNYFNYYILENDEYVPVDHKRSAEYSLLKTEPLDWQTNYGAYYKRKVSSEVVYDITGKIVNENGFAKIRKFGDGYEPVYAINGSAPVWKPDRYFQRNQKIDAPIFDDGVVKYKMTKTVTAPTWHTNQFYNLKKAGKVPAFKAGVYYRLVVDHYADLVSVGIKRLKEIVKQRNFINANFGLQSEYDIGDVVGARDETTGIEVWQPITKKIVSIDKRGKNIGYKVGDMK